MTLHVVLIALLGLLAYSNTFDVPFQWDDRFLIEKNLVLRDLHNFIDPSKARLYPEYSSFRMRYVSFLTFALNYHVHGLDVRGYHVVNISVHILNALLVYALLVLTFRTPYFNGSRLSKGSNVMALLSALIFVSHPVQTEAVTYIMARFVDLSAFFYLLSLVLYIKFRLSYNGRGFFSYRSLIYYVACIVSALLAYKSKETALTLPLAIALYELFFFTGAAGRRMLLILPMLLTLIIFPFELAESGMPAHEVLSGSGSNLEGHIDKSLFAKDYLSYPSQLRWDYFITEFRVVVTYLRLLAVPVKQTLVYDYPLYHSFEPYVFLSLLFLLSLLGLGVYFYYRSRVTDHALRIASFGIFWFFLVISVESSIIPLPMIIQEYRLYLPSAGVIIAVVSLGSILFEKIKYNKVKIIITVFFVLLPVALLAATYERNNVWKTRISLWEDVVEKSPQKEIGHNNLGNAYKSEGLTDKAIEQYLIAIRLNPDFERAHLNLGIAFESKGLTDKAIEQYLIAIRLNPDYDKAHFNLGIDYLEKGFTEKARSEFETTLRINPGFYQAERFLDYLSRDE